MTVEPTLADVAHHEAAHAVAYLVTGGVFEEVSIVPSENRESFGGVRHKFITFNEFEAMPRTTLHDYIFICLAGSEWGCRRTGKADPLLCRFDWERRDLLMMIIPPEEQHYTQNEIRARVQTFVSDPVQQARIERVAQALLEHNCLTFDQVATLIE